MSWLSEFGQTGLPLFNLGVVFGRWGEVLLELLDYGGLMVTVVTWGSDEPFDVRMLVIFRLDVLILLTLELLFLLFSHFTHVLF